MHPVRVRRLVLVLVWLLAAVPAAGQVSAMQVTSDNDAYDFWVPMDVRPDWEYTNGFRVAAELPGAPAWGRLAGAAAACAEDAPGCATTTVEFGHRLYTPRQDSYTPLAGQRHFAGWLYAAATARVVRGATRRTAGLEVGVTGPASLGRPLMEKYHRMAGFWEPVGWRHQLAFEPAFAARAGVDRRLAEVRAGGLRVADVEASATGALGTLRTGAAASLRARAGYDVPDAWTGRRATGVAFYLLGGAGGEYVARDLFLDGNTFGGDGARVTRRPWVGQLTAGAGFAAAQLGVEYRVASRSREYQEEPAGHTYATIEITWRR
ncbi:MAG TPA: lipid A deacylase LpxR family protein [Longimicrobium sp.]|nr:lipid A deacylase LpxR family protein [Longimicrobium sp.]